MLRCIERDGFHYTANYFWVHQVAYHIAVAIKGPPQGLFTFTTHVAPVFAAFNHPNYHIPTTMTLEGSLEEKSPTTTATSEEGQISTVTPADSKSETPLDAEQEENKSYPYCSISFTEFLARPHCQKLRNSQLYSK